MTQAVAEKTNLEQELDGMAVRCLEKAEEMESYAQEFSLKKDELTAEAYRNEAKYFIKMYEQWK